MPLDIEPRFRNGRCSTRLNSVSRATCLKADPKPDIVPVNRSFGLFKRRSMLTSANAARRCNAAVSKTIRRRACKNREREREREKGWERGEEKGKSDQRTQGERSIKSRDHACPCVRPRALECTRVIRRAATSDCSSLAIVPGT